MEGALSQRLAARTRSHQYSRLVRVQDENVGIVAGACVAVREKPVKNPNPSGIYFVDDGSGGVCYYTALPRCCSTANSAIAVDGKSEVTFNSKRFEVNFARTDESAGGVCFRVLSNEVRRCETSQRCIDEACSPTTPVCQKNVLPGTECDADSGCTCKRGYTGFGCCDCDQELGFVEIDGTEQCENICIENCNRPATNLQGVLIGCSECRPGFTLNGRTCCCREDQVRDSNGRCICPSGTIEINGMCCPNGTIVINGKCERICSQNCDSFNGQVCGTCREGYESPPRCCDCASDRVKMGDECLCPGNKVPVKGVCQCPPGTTETADNVCTTECDKDQNVLFVLDTTQSFGPSHLQPTIYAIELVISALMELDSSNVGTALVEYPVGIAESDKTITITRTASLTLSPTADCSSAIASLDSIARRYRFQENTVTLAMDALNFIANEDIIARFDVPRPTRVITITDGVSDTVGGRNTTQEIADAIRTIGQKHGDTEFYAAGVQVSKESTTTNVDDLRDELKSLAGGDMSHTSLTTAESDRDVFIRDLLQLLVRAGVICDEQRQEIANRITGVSNFRMNQYVFCVDTRGREPSTCRRQSPPLTEPCSAKAFNEKVSSYRSLKERILEAIEQVLH